VACGTTTDFWFLQSTAVFCVAVFPTVSRRVIFTISAIFIILLKGLHDFAYIYNDIKLKWPSK